MNKIVITGALGHIGSRLIQELPLFYDNLNIVMIDNLSSQRYCSCLIYLKNAKYKFIEGDITCVDSVEIFNHARVVIHLAAITDAAVTAWVMKRPDLLPGILSQISMGRVASRGRLERWSPSSRPTIRAISPANPSTSTAAGWASKMALPEDLLRLDGKVALVTGGYGGIGESVSLGLAAAGAKVAIAGHSREKACAAAAALCEIGHQAYAATFEARSVPETQAMVDEVANPFRRAGYSGQLRRSQSRTEGRRVLRRALRFRRRCQPESLYVPGVGRRASHDSRGLGRQAGSHWFRTNAACAARPGLRRLLRRQGRTRNSMQAIGRRVSCTGSTSTWWPPPSRARI